MRPQPLEYLDSLCQLHENIEVVYLVDCYRATFYCFDGNIIFTYAEGRTIFTALKNLNNKLRANKITLEHIRSGRFFDY